MGPLRAICAGLPETYEEPAWTGVRWRVRTKTFAHVLTVDAAWPPMYARAVQVDAPTFILHFRSPSPELEALRESGHPFFHLPWPEDNVGMILAPGARGAGVDWEEVRELLTESYCVLAPKKLVGLIDRPDRS